MSPHYNLSPNRLHLGRRADQPSILPLPDHVAAQMKSATTIVSLNHVVLELMKNALDAKAGQVDLTVDFARGGCTVEDDGQGISPLEFREEGGLGKLYCTSKYHSQDLCLGHNGTFLSSLAAMSLMTITSRHHQHRSTNAVTFHHSKIIQRELPASTHNQVHTKHGTRVTVRNLFGNLPVRVKHRSIILDRRTEYDRMWAALKKDTASLLLSWQGTISLRVRDGDNKTIFSFNISEETGKERDHHRNTLKPRSRQLSFILNILTQANCISVDEWTSWVPASARTSSLSIKGAISLNPAPSKNIQFISLGIRPLLVLSGHNELFDHVNRLFSLSSFGTIEDDDVDELETSHRQSDKLHKIAGYTNRQIKGRKDVDRYPMFCLQISLNGNHEANTAEDRLLESEVNLRNVLEVMSAMITQWLSTHHFRPRLPRKKYIRSVTSVTSMSQMTELDDATLPEVGLTLDPLSGKLPRSRLPRSGSTDAASIREKRQISPKPHESAPKGQRRAFAEWSRIKSGRANFFHNLTTLPKPISTAASHDDRSVGMQSIPFTDAQNFSSLRNESIPQGAFGQPAPHEDNFEVAIESLNENDIGDETVCWVDPSSKKSFVLNARTGSILSDTQPRQRTEFTPSMLPTTQNSSNKSLRLAFKSKVAVPAKSLWLDEVLQTWDNPVFKPSEPQIQRAFGQGQEMENGCNQRSQYGYSYLNMNQDFYEASASDPCKLSKEDLQNAQVIAQVDKKFILTKMPNSTVLKASEKLPTELLVLVDQHAADERVQVEMLWKELCTTPVTNVSRNTYQSKLGHSSQIASAILKKPVQFSISAQERIHFTTHAARFAAWGILYDLPIQPASLEPTRQANNQSLLYVTSLPPIISSRCTSDPKVLISLLRSTVWHFASSDTPLPPLASPLSSSTTKNWVRRIANCPPALTDMVNSRACRSAIMFNDELSKEECEALVKKLAGCVFPFMCAHGRPSMVPLGDLGLLGGGGEDFAGKCEESFVGAWKKWSK